MGHTVRNISWARGPHIRDHSERLGPHNREHFVGMWATQLRRLRGDLGHKVAAISWGLRPHSRDHSADTGATHPVTLRGSLGHTLAATWAARRGHITRSRHIGRQRSRDPRVRFVTHNRRMRTGSFDHHVHHAHMHHRTGCVRWGQSCSNLAHVFRKFVLSRQGNLFRFPESCCQTFRLSSP